MRLLAHFAAADVRRFKSYIGIWIVVVAGAACIEVFAPSIDRGSRFRAFGLALTLLRFADLALALSLVAFIVQAHPLVGSDAFWMTRPIRWNTLLISKLALLWPLLVGIPVAGDVVYMSFHDVPVAHLSLGVLQMALFRTLALMVVMAAAAATPNVARFALVSAGALIVAAVTFVAGRLLFDTRPYMSGVVVYDGFGMPVGQHGRDFTWLVVGTCLGITATVAFLAHQYRSRALGRSVAVGLAGAVIAVAAGWVWPWRMLSDRVPAPSWAQAATGMHLTVDENSIGFDWLRYGGEDVRWRLGWAPVRLRGVPAGWIASARLQRASLDYDGDRLASLGHVTSVLLRFDERHQDEAPLPATIRDVLGVSRFGGNITQVSGPRAIAFVAPIDELKRDRSISALYRGEFMIDLTRLEVAAVLPLTSGASFQDGAYRVRIDEIRRADPGLSIRTRLSNVHTIFDRTPSPTFRFFLRNTQQAQATEGTVNYRRPPTALGPGAWSGFRAFDGDLFFPDMYRALPAGSLELDDAWLERAELVILRSIYDGSVPRTLEMQGVRVTVASANADAERRR